MIKTLLVVGKEYSQDPEFVNSAIDDGKIVVSATNIEDTEILRPKAPSMSFLWHPSSPVSARSMVLKTETTLESLDCGILFFDTYSFIQEYEKLSADVFTRGVDNMFLGYSYVTAELYNRFVLKEKGVLCFVLNSAPSLLSITKNNSKAVQGIKKPSPFVSAMEAAFKTFAENCAAQFLTAKIPVLLVENNTDQDLSLGNWLLPYLEEFAHNFTQKITKNSFQWVEKGAKLSSGKLFRK
jgi:hypothetical protein